MNNYFCVLPFFSYELGTQATSNIYCCRLAANTDILSVRNSMMLGQRAAECTACWSLEDAGLESERQIHNRTFDWLLDRDLETIESQVKQGNFSTQIVKLATSNLCNGQCIICSSDASSSWAQLRPSKKTYQILPQHSYSNIDWSQVRQLTFLGGEPLLEKKNFQILETLISLKNTSCLISFITNGSVELSLHQKNILANFSNLNFCISIDGIEKNFEYLRFPLRWDTLLANIAFMKTISTNISVSATVTNLSIFDYANLIDFFLEQKLPYICKPIENPAVFSPSNWPHDIRELILSRNQKYHDQVRHFLWSKNFSAALYQDFLLEVDNQDFLKKIQIKDFMPEVAEILDNKNYRVQGKCP